MENLLLIEVTVALGADEDGELVLGWAVVETRDQHATLLPRLGVERAAAIGVFRRFRDPHAATLVPLDGDGLIDERLGDDSRRLEARLEAELGDRVSRPARTAHRITQVRELGRNAKFVDIGALGNPGHPALQESVDAGVAQRDGIALEQHHGAMVSGLKHPGLRLDVIHRGTAGFGLTASIGDLGSEGSGKNESLIIQGEVVDRVIFDVEGGEILDQRVGIGADIQHGGGTELLAVGGPSAAEVLAGPLGRGAGDGTVHDDQAVAGLREIGEGLLAGGAVGGELGLIKQGDVDLTQVSGQRGRGAADFRAALDKRSREVSADRILVADDEHLQGRGREEGDGAKGGQTHEVAETG